jgi:four helix bundle protein
LLSDSASEQGVSQSAQSHRDLKVWQIALDLTESLYRLSGDWPKHEQYGLVNQIRRASVSIAANIAEGAGRRTTGEFIQFVGIARGSLAEVETLLMIARRLGYVEDEVCQALLRDIYELGRMTTGLIQSLEVRKGTPPR